MKNIHIYFGDCRYLSGIQKDMLQKFKQKLVEDLAQECLVYDAAINPNGHGGHTCIINVPTHLLVLAPIFPFHCSLLFINECLHPENRREYCTVPVLVCFFGKEINPGDTCFSSPRPGLIARNFLSGIDSRCIEHSIDMLTSLILLSLRSPLPVSLDQNERQTIRSVPSQELNHA